MGALMIGVAGVIAVAAITPGPNNLVVMRAAAQAGFLGALPAIAGILAGGLVMLALAMAGAGVLFADEPRLYLVIAAGGGAYLCWLGTRLVMNSFAPPRTQAAPPALPAGAPALFAFQFFNPKSWVLVLTVTAAVQGGAEPTQAWWPLAALFTVIPALCLALWSLLGVAMMGSLGRLRVRGWIDRVLGLLLIASALLLVLVPAAPLV